MEKLVNTQLSNVPLIRAMPNPEADLPGRVRVFHPGGRNGRTEARLRYWYNFYLLSFISINKPLFPFCAPLWWAWFNELSGIASIETGYKLENSPEIIWFHRVKDNCGWWELEEECQSCVSLTVGKKEKGMRNENEALGTCYFEAILCNPLILKKAKSKDTWLAYQLLFFP